MWRFVSLPVSRLWREDGSPVALMVVSGLLCFRSFRLMSHVGIDAVCKPTAQRGYT